MTYPRRGEVYWTDLDPTRGAEMRKTRPCLVITDDLINRRRMTVVVVPLSSTSPRNFPIHVPLLSISATSQAVIDQIRVVDKERIGGWIGTVEASEMRSVEDALRMVLAIG